MKIFSCMAVALYLAATCSAELPGFYNTVNRITWLVADLDHAKRGWIPLGMSDIQEYPELQFAGEFHGKPVTIQARQITGHLGNLTVDMIQPAKGQGNAFTEFLAQHGDGIFSIVHEVASTEAMAGEIKRLESTGVAVLQKVTVKEKNTSVRFAYFDTAREGKFVLGLVYWPGGAPVTEGRAMVSHLAPVKSRQHCQRSKPVSARPSATFLRLFWVACAVASLWYRSLPFSETSSACRKYERSPVCSPKSRRAYPT